MRKSIFDKILEDKNFKKEFERIEKLINDNKGIEIDSKNSDIFKSFAIATGSKVVTSFSSIVERANLSFKKWKNRGTCIDYYDFRKQLKIDHIITSPYFEITTDDIATYAEFVANMVFIALNSTINEDERIYRTDVCETIMSNLTTILNWLNYEMKEFDNEEKILVVEKSNLVSEVVDFVDDNTSYKIVEYNHHSLKGDISSKKAILLKLGADLEPKRSNLTSANKKLSENIFFMLNNLNIRHNNTSEKDKNFKPYVAGLSNDELEKWYDELYHMILLGILELEQLDRNVRIDNLKSKIC